MLDSYFNEEWKEVDFGRKKVKFRYFVSNYGKVRSQTIKIKDPHYLKECLTNGYPVFSITISGKLTTIYLHKMVAELFLEKESEDLTYVIHLDYNIKNNYVKNLKWVTISEMAKHGARSPSSVAARERLKLNPRFQGHKLNSTQVMLIKKKLFDPNRKTRMKMIAKQFGISEMQLYRIKTGENWGHVKVDIRDKKKD